MNGSKYVIRLQAKVLKYNLITPLINSCLISVTLELFEEIIGFHS